MMPQKEAYEPIYEQGDQTYGRYEGDQAFTRHSDERLEDQTLREAQGEKVYSPRLDNKNVLRLIMFVIAMVTLLLCAVLCIFFIGGEGGWISLCAISGVIFLIAVVAISKIE